MMVRQLVDKASTITGWLAGGAVIVMMVHVCIDVIGKYVFNAPVPGTITIVTQYYMPLLTFLPLAWVHRARGHIAVEVAARHFPGRLQHHLHYSAILLGILIFGLLAFTTLQEALQKQAINTFTMEQRIRVVTWPGYFFPVLGYGLVTLAMLIEYIAYLTGRAPQEVID